jgi:ferredoxin
LEAILTKDFLATDSFQSFIEELSQFGILLGPSLTEDGVPAFIPLGSTADLHIDYRRTLIPPKKYLIPPRETVLTFVPEHGYALPAPAVGETILFGLHPCDLAAISYLDRVFLEDRPDPLYQERRNTITLIGLSCEPDEFCFCTALGTDTPDHFDIYLEMVEGGFRVQKGSPRGEAIISAISCLRDGGGPISPPFVVADLAEQIRAAAEHQETFPESPLWENFADRCLSCGACSLCCPTCYCFDVREYGNLDGRNAERQREWDNCLFKSHGEVAGGYSFRKTRQERFRYRFLHKYLGFGPLRGVVSCVGCGRCREVCPVKIDLLELFQQQ